jgi:ribosome-binding protein aMBF1 (putative translation factor)
MHKENRPIALDNYRKITILKAFGGKIDASNRGYHVPGKRWNWIMKSKKTSGTFDILHRRYIGGDTERQVSLEVERVNAEVARTIYELRKKAGLTQKELAHMVGTTQSVISRLEDADYEGHSLSMLHRIAMALNRRLSVQMIEPFSERVATVLPPYQSNINQQDQGAAKGKK